MILTIKFFKIFDDIKKKMLNNTLLNIFYV